MTMCVYIYTYKHTRIRIPHPLQQNMSSFKHANSPIPKQPRLGDAERGIGACRQIAWDLSTKGLGLIELMVFSVRYAHVKAPTGGGGTPFLAWPMDTARLTTEQLPSPVHVSLVYDSGYQYMSNYEPERKISAENERQCCPTPYRFRPSNL